MRALKRYGPSCYGLVGCTNPVRFREFSKFLFSCEQCTMPLEQAYADGTPFHWYRLTRIDLLRLTVASLLHSIANRIESLQSANAGKPQSVETAQESAKNKSENL